MRILILLATALLAGCATPHNDVLVFGTNTSLGIHVGLQPETGTVPQVSIGYKRQEAVYMPLTINARDSAFACATWNNASDTCTEFRQFASNVEQAVDGIKYTGRGEPWPPESNRRGGGEDAYSVFASFGGRAQGSRDGASMALAQFFATGIAAQRLSASSQVSSLVSTTSAEEEELRKIAELERALGVARVELIRETSESRQAAAALTGERLRGAQAIADFVCVNGRIVPENVTRILPEAMDQSSKDALRSDLGTGDCTVADTVQKLQSRWRNMINQMQNSLPEPSE